MPLLFLACLLVAAPASAEDGRGDRYRAIRAPTEALVARIARQRLQAELNALSREQVREQIRRRLAERLQFQDPSARSRIERRDREGRLVEIRVERQEAAARLSRLSRRAPTMPAVELPSFRSVEDGRLAADLLSVDPDGGSADAAIAAARSFVSDLLRANRARP